MNEGKYTYRSGDLVLPQCVLCRHLSNDKTRWACGAYPQGIPQEIPDNEVDHRRPLIGDGGIHWEVSANADPRAVRTLTHYLDNQKLGANGYD